MLTLAHTYVLYGIVLCCVVRKSPPSVRIPIPPPCHRRHRRRRRHRCCRRVLKFLDMLGLLISVVLNVMLLAKFGLGHDKPDMLWHFFPVLLYLSTGLVQLVALLLWPELHQRHRFAINLANRLLKALTVTWAAVNMSQTTVMQHFTGTLNSVPLGIAGVHSTAAYMKVLRTVASLPLLWVSHAVNFMLPFWLLLPLQLYTLLAVSKVIPAIVCVLLGQPPHILQPAAVMATHVGWSIRTMIALAVPFPCSWPWELSASGARGTGGCPYSSVAQELLLLVAVTFTMVRAPQAFPGGVVVFLFT